MPEDEPRFLCDEMLQGLGRWLRAAGYDTLIINDGRSDQTLVDLAQRTKRVLLTRDRAMASSVLQEGQLVILECDTMDECAAETGRRLGINWFHAPFSRCLLCNTLLETASPGLRQQLPEDVREGVVLYCPCCDKPYWEGSHVRRMRQRLRQWACPDSV